MRLLLTHNSGGPDKLMETESSDVTGPFENAAHSEDARELLKTMLVGSLRADVGLITY